MPISDFREPESAEVVNLGRLAWVSAIAAAGVQSPLPLSGIMSARTRCITLFLSTPTGNYSEVYATESEVLGGDLRKWKEFLLARRKCLVFGAKILSAIVPWEEEPIFFYPPLGSVLPSAYLDARGEIRCS
jgi:hypothetical protein